MGRTVKFFAGPVQIVGPRHVLVGCAFNRYPCLAGQKRRSWAQMMRFPHLHLPSRYYRYWCDGHSQISQIIMCIYNADSAARFFEATRIYNRSRLRWSGSRGSIRKMRHDCDRCRRARNSMHLAVLICSQNVRNCIESSQPHLQKSGKYSRSIGFRCSHSGGIPGIFPTRRYCD